MASVLVSLLCSGRFLVRPPAAPHLEITALRHQLAVVNRSGRPRPFLTAADRMLWAWLSARLIGSIRRECLDHVIVVNASGLHRVLLV